MAFPVTMVRMRFSVEPSPSGGYFVRAEGVPAPVSRHDTEEEAEAAAAAYARGVSREDRSGERVRLRDGTEVIVRPVRAEDKPLFVAGWERFGEQSRYRRFMAAKQQLSVDELAFFTELDHVDHEAIGASSTRSPARASGWPATSATPDGRTRPRRRWR